MKRSYQSKEEKTLKLLMAAIVILVGIIVFQHMAVIVKYEGYDGKAKAVIQNVEMRHVYVKASSYEEYKIYYTYMVNGRECSAESEWITTSSDLRIGKEIGVCFDMDNPENAILELEKADSEGTLWGIVLAIAVIGGIKLFADRSNKKYY